MFRFVRTQRSDFSAQAMILYYENECYYPCIHHTAVGQDRPVGPPDTFRPHKHNLYHVVVYTRASGAFSLEGQVIEAEPGTVVCVSPGQWHDFVSYRRQAVYSEVTFSFETQGGRTLQISLEQVLRLFTGLPLSLRPWQRIPIEKALHLESLILRITDHARSGSNTADYCWQYSLGCLLDALVWSCAQFQTVQPVPDERLLHVRQFIEMHYPEPITAETLATMAGLSRGYLFRAFRAAFGKPPLAYQQQLRLEAAKTLLRSTALRCKEVAARCGYDNVAHFCRLFRRATGLSPSRFRRQATRSHRPGGG
ncbi:MAG: AraC family transcriptional regulator [Sedimentisphaerales bacterium]|jgi:AraC-like DNA-binding protein|nr:AraC family transcriptional regulator [Sedimentisphaerales bacterium]